MEQLPIFLNLRGVPVLLIGTGDAAEPKRRLIEGAGGIVVDTPTPDTRIAFIALEDKEAAAAAAAQWRAHGLLVNVVDQPALCDFTMPSIVDRAPVTVAIGTAGASASLAKLLRERFEQLLPTTLGALAKAIAAARADVSAHHTSPRARRHFWDGLLAPGGALDPLADQDKPQDKIRAALHAPTAAARQIDIVKLSSPHADDLTLRHARLLAQADVVLHKADIAPDILARARRDAALHVLGTIDPQTLDGRIVIVE